MGREILEGKNVVSGKPDDTNRIDGPGQLATGAHHRLQCLGCLVVGDDHDCGLAGRARHQRQIESASG